MSENVGTETTRPDGAGADESPFGDAADLKPAASAEGPESGEEKTPEQGDAGGENPRDARAAGQDVQKAAPREDLKVVVSFRGGWATVGVQRPESDPHIETFGGLDGPGAAREVTAVIERARAKWVESPRHPAYARPAPPAGGGNRLGQEAAQDAAGQEQEQQQTLRLF